MQGAIETNRSNGGRRAVAKTRQLILSNAEESGERDDKNDGEKRWARSKFAERLGVIVESGGRNLSFGGTSDGRRSRVPIVARSRRMVASSLFS